MKNKNQENEMFSPSNMEKNHHYAEKKTFGVKDILLTYVPGTKDDLRQLTEDMLLPYVSYIQNEKIMDTLFDGYLFLPYVSFLYQGMEKKPLTKNQWQEYLENQFVADRNVSALNKAVAKVKSELQIPDYKVKIYFSIFYPVKSVSNFGDIKGENLNFSNLEQRITAVKWMIDSQLRLFEEGDYPNLELGGFYWFTEEMDFSDRDLISLIHETTDYVRSLGLITTWIPYYQATGYRKWQEVGFDLGCYQPNYAFNFNIPKTRLYEAYEEAKELGMCAELEIGKLSVEDVKRMKDYFQVAAEVGVMKEAVHMYYQDAGPGVFYQSYVSEDPTLHGLYEDLYLFIKNQYSD